MHAVIPSSPHPHSEITGGMLWTTGSQACTDGGRLGGGCTNNWASLVNYVDAGVKAVRAVVPAAQVRIIIP